MFEALQILLVVYFLTLALTAPLGLHRPLLVYPARAIYALFAFLLLLLSFGRLRLQSPFQSAWRKSKRGSRSFRSALRDWRREKEEERIIWSANEKGSDPLSLLKDQEKEREEKLL